MTVNVRHNDGTSNVIDDLIKSLNGNAKDISRFETLHAKECNSDERSNLLDKLRELLQIRIKMLIYLTALLDLKKS